MDGPSQRQRVALVGLAVLTLSLAPATCLAQGTGGPLVAGSRVGYVDSAIPGDLFRFRFDASYGSNRPTRAEVFWPQAGSPNAPGPPNKEFRVDYQEFHLSLEKALGERFSCSVEMPLRLVNPAVDPNAGGVGDLNAALKVAFLYSDDLVASFQLRTYAPTGDARLGLGNHHVSVEPAVLVWAPLLEDLLFEGEFRLWVPIGGTSFAGEVVRYGAGLSYDLWESDETSLGPVVEVVGWTVLGGKVSAIEPSGLGGVQAASGDTIVNLKVGARLDLGRRTGLYAGYGRALTGERWYQDTFRVEFRLAY